MRAAPLRRGRYTPREPDMIRAMRFSEDFIRALRDRVSIVDFAGRRLQWDRKKSLPAKGEYWACCPFHGEKSASFHVREQQKSFYCFGCQAKGGVIDLAMRLDGCSFPEAVERLAGFAGMALPESSSEEDRAASERRQRLFNVLRAAGELYQQTLSGADGGGARSYLAKRGLDPEICRRFGIGYAPDKWTFAIDQLRSSGFALDDLIAAGLAKPSEGRRPIDFFRNRILFPITDLQGRIIAFGGRTLEKDNPAKYLNSPETPLFHKGASLYRAAEARKRMAQERSAVLVAAEGYLDVVALERAGFAAVAPLGTALTPEQLAQLWKLSPEPVLCFDGDQAGQRAADRALDLALAKLAPERTVRIALLPQGQDPDDVLRSQGSEALRGMIASASPAVERLFAREAAAQPLDTPERKAGLRKRLRSLAEQIEDPDTRSLYVQALRSKLDTLWSDTSRPAPPAPLGPPGPWRRERKGQRFAAPEIRVGAELKSRAKAQMAEGSGSSSLVEALLRQGIRCPQALHLGADQLAALPIDDPLLDQVRHAVLDLLAAGTAVDQEALSNHLAAVGHVMARSRVASWRGASLELEASAHATAEWLALLEQAASERVIEEEFRAVADTDQSDDEALARAQRLAVERAALMRRTLKSRQN